MLVDILDRHRGPYLFCVSRPHNKKKKGFHRSEWLKGSVEHEDVGPEALALLQDPRDTIEHVGVYSEREQCFVTVIRGERDL
jgi:hypothetical protein